MDSNRKFLLTQKALICILAILSILGVALPFFFGHPNLSLLGLYISVPMILSLVIFILYKTKMSEEYNIKASQFKNFILLYILIYILSIFILLIFETRNIIYFGLITFLYITVIIEILFFDLSSKMAVPVIIQLSLAILNIIWGVTLKYYFFIDRTDTIVHTWFLSNLINYGYVTEAFEIYSPFPLWHILSSYIYIISNINIPPFKVMFLLSGLISFFLILIVYILSLQVFNNIKIALLATFIVSIFPDVTYFGMSSISRSAIIFLFPIMLLSLKNFYKDISYRIIFALVSISIIVYHTVSMPFILAILIVIYAVQMSYISNKDLKFISAEHIAFLFLISLIYWVNNATPLFQSLIEHILTPPPSGALPSAVTRFPIAELFNYIQFSFLLFFIILGGLWILEAEDKYFLAKIFSIVSLLFAAVTFPGPALLIDKLLANFNFTRFGEYAYVFMAISAAYGIFKFNSKIIGNKKIFILIMISFMVFLSISNDFVASDSPIVKRPFYNFYLNEEEVNGFDFIANNSLGYVMSDYVTYRYLLYSKHRSKSHILEIDDVNKNFLENCTKDLILIRTKELSTRPLKLFSSNESSFKLDPDLYVSSRPTDYYYKENPLWNRLDSSNKLYDSGGVGSYNLNQSV
jgi:hypothetical protein